LFKGLKRLVKLIILVLGIYVAIQAVMMLFPLKYEDAVERNAQANNLEKSLVYGIINAESRFDKDAVSKRGAVGLMQVKEDTALWCAEKMEHMCSGDPDLKNPDTNIEIGTWYFSYLKHELGTQELAIIAYNAGISHVKEWLEEGLIDEKVSSPDNIPFEETRKYIKKVKIYTGIYRVINKAKDILPVVKDLGGIYEKLKI